MMRSFLFPLHRWMRPLLGLAVLTIVGCRGLSTGGVPQPLTPLAAVRSRVILVVLENQKFHAIIGNPRAPFLNQLAQQYAIATNYYANTHPSIGDYFMLTVGRIVSNSLVFQDAVTDDNIVRELGQHSLSWKAYLESIPRTGYMGDRAYPYAKPHNPIAYFLDTMVYASQAQNMVSTDELQTDLTSGKLPAFVYIAPNQFHNMHDCLNGVGTCTNDDKIAAGDQWLQQTLGPIIQAPSFARRNTLLLITWDESFDKDFDHGGGHVPLIVVSPDVKPGFQLDTYFQHEAVLRLIQERLGLPVVLGASSQAPSLQGFFTDATSSSP